MDQINDSLTRISELSSEELDQLASQIISEFDVVASQDTTQESVQRLQELSAAMQSVTAEREGRAAKVAELAAAKEAAAEQFSAAKGESKDSDEDEDEVVEDDDEDKELSSQSETNSDNELSSREDAGEPEVQEAGEPAPEEEAAVESAVTDEPAPAAEEVAVPEDAPASDDNPQVETELSTDEDNSEAEQEQTEELSTRKDSEAEMSATDNQDTPEVPESHRPSVEVDEAPRAAVTITAGGDIPNVSAGSELSDMSHVAKAMTERIKAISRTTGGDGEMFSVATLNVEYPEDRTLDGNDEGNKNKIAKVVSPEAITAAGGFCAPVEVSYDVFGFGSTERPVKNSLAAFAADRGGIRYTTSPVLGDLSGAVSLWTLQDDIDASTDGAPNPTKPCLRVNCGEEVVVHTDAIPLCLTFGNLQTRAFPEMVKRNNELALIEHARYSEVRLLTRIGALSTAVTAAQKLGAARDFFMQVDQAAAGYRSRHRLSPTESLRVIVPHWFKNMIRADITASMPGGDDQDRFGIADNIVDAWFRARNINVTWSLDGEAGQIFGAQDAGTLDAFPSTLVWYLFAEGTFLFLDGGTLDLGLVRDSSLNSTNDYKMFVETFEAVAKVGIESLRITSTLAVNGAVAGTVNPVTTP